MFELRDSRREAKELVRLCQTGASTIAECRAMIAINARQRKIIAANFSSNSVSALRYVSYRQEVANEFSRLVAAGFEVKQPSPRPPNRQRNGRRRETAPRQGSSREKFSSIGRALREVSAANRRVGAIL